VAGFCPKNNGFAVCPSQAPPASLAHTPMAGWVVCAVHLWFKSAPLITVFLTLVRYQIFYITLQTQKVTKP